MLSHLFAVMFAAAVGIGPVNTAELTPAERCASLCHDKPCENYEFHGFSPDSTRYGYSHLTCPGKLESAKARFTYHLRRIRPGKRKRSTEGIALEGVTFPGYFTSNNYEIGELQPKITGKQKYEFRNARGLEVAIELATEKKVAWYFHVKGRKGERFTYRGEFEEIYFGLQPRVFISPDGQRAAVLLLLDAMVRVDAALVIFSLNP